jgi:hypothetical protein
MLILINRVLIRSECGDAMRHPLHHVETRYGTLPFPYLYALANCGPGNHGAHLDHLIIATVQSIIRSNVTINIYLASGMNIATGYPYT